MNLIMIKHKKDTEDLLLSMIKICETPNEQTHRGAEEPLEFKLSRSTERFHFQPSLNLGHD